MQIRFENLIALLLTILLLHSCNNSKPEQDSAVIETAYGDITIKLFPVQAPKTVQAFKKNCISKVYAGGSFYRVVKSENVALQYQKGILQGGIYQTNAALETSLTPIPHEAPAVSGISHTDGTISMARNEPGTAKSEFFICVGDQTQFDSSRRTNSDGMGYAAFGRVTKGMDIVKKIFSNQNDGDEILHPVAIRKITYY